MPQHPSEADMTPRIPEHVSTWLVNWSLVSNTPPPRDPNDDNDEDDEDDERHDERHDEDDEDDEDDEPAVVREPDPVELRGDSAAC